MDTVDFHRAAHQSLVTGAGVGELLAPGISNIDGKPVLMTVNSGNKSGRPNTFGCSHGIRTLNSESPPATMMGKASRKSSQVMLQLKSTLSILETHQKDGNLIFYHQRKLEKFLISILSMKARSTSG